ncbi:hypothetical protein RRG08_046299 [Elysia crispata]|uniref:RRM domain-containing protein n=1 Tax=Elysia crispata TaxID=231223 RepID=A0AAE1A4F4_9GAST|nr:hypothetical protein RRG08_046299 [Elysia crispata]
MATSIPEESVSGTSHDNLPREKSISVASTVETPSERKADNCLEVCSGRQARRVFFKSPLAASLAKLITVSPLQFGKDAVPSLNQRVKADRAQYLPALKKEDPHISNIDLQVYGFARSTGAPEDRPGWTATNHEMAEDLIHNKVTIAKDMTFLPEELRESRRSSLIKNLALLPFHCLLVKWKMSFSFPVYTPRMVFGILSRFGAIQSMGVLSQNSAFVIFRHEYHACRAILSQQVGFNNCPLILCWWYKERYRLPLTDAADVKREDLLLSDGRLERNSKRHIAQIKREFWRKAAALSYDVSTFRP